MKKHRNIPEEAQNVTECNGECNGSKMRKCLGFNVCNGVTAVSEQWSGAEPPSPSYGAASMESA